MSLQDDSNAVKKDELIDAALDYKNFGLKSNICNACDLRYRDLAEFLKDDEAFAKEFKDCCNDIKQEIKDKIEAKLIEDGMAGNNRGMEYFLNNQAAERGYGDGKVGDEEQDYAEMIMPDGKGVNI